MGMINTKFCGTVHVGNHSFEIIGDSIDGSTDKVNQDSFGFYHDDECLIVAVADGLGSAPLSQIGSECIVETVMEVLSDPDPGDIWRQISEKWKSSIEGPLDQYDTTCKFICIRNGKATVGSIGDGWIGMLHTNGYQELENSNVFTNITESICSPKLMDRTYTGECDLDDIISFGISTDGFSEDFDRESRFEFLHDVCDDMSGDLRATRDAIRTALKNWPVKSNKDDKTLILVRKVE